MPRPVTRERILDGFLTLAGREGLAGVTTRAVAAEAGVNEVTLFRHFGDKATLTRAAMEHLIWRASPPPPPGKPVAGSPGLQRVVELMRGNRNGLTARPEVMQLGVIESFNDPAISELVKAAPMGVWQMYRKAFEDAREELQAGVDTDAAALAVQGLVFLTAFWNRRGFVSWGKDEWDSIFVAAVRPYFKEGSRD
jgi:AcrR family transcriptional regulator